MENLSTEKNSKAFSFLKVIFDKLNYKNYKKEPHLRFLAIFSFVFILAIFSSYFILSSPSNFPRGVTFQVEKGKTLKGVSLDLKEQNIIRSRIAFESLSILLGGERKIKEGYYLFEERISVLEVARRISKGERHLPSIKITIPEGFTVEEMSELFKNKLPDFNTEKFLTIAESKEGYLFPDTYFFSLGDNYQEVIEYLENNYEKKISPLRPEFTKKGKTEKEIITMASIIEKEAKGKNDRGIISGILWRRLGIGMPLQVDADMDTYKNKGLPENPISNPGLKAIESALNPVSSVYLYYLHDSDGMIHFARSFEEHKQNISKYLRN